MVGFINSLAVFVFASQVPHLIGVPWLVYPLVALGIGIIILTPKITKAIPAPLIAVVAVTTAVVVLNIEVPTVGDEGALPRSLPSLFLPQVPISWQTLQILLPPTRLRSP